MGSIASGQSLRTLESTARSGISSRCSYSIPAPETSPRRGDVPKFRINWRFGW